MLTVNSANKFLNPVVASALNALSKKFQLHNFRAQNGNLHSRIHAVQTKQDSKSHETRRQN